MSSTAGRCVGHCLGISSAVHWRVDGRCVGHCPGVSCAVHWRMDGTLHWDATNRALNSSSALWCRASAVLSVSRAFSCVCPASTCGFQRRGGGKAVSRAKGPSESREMGVCIHTLMEETCGLVEAQRKRAKSRRKRARVVAKNFSSSAFLKGREKGERKEAERDEEVHKYSVYQRTYAEYQRRRREE